MCATHAEKEGEQNSFDLPDFPHVGRPSSRQTYLFFLDFQKREKQGEHTDKRQREVCACTQTLFFLAYITSD